MIGSRQPRPRIAQHRPLRRALLVVALLASALLAIWQAYRLGLDSAGAGEPVAAGYEDESMLEELRLLAARNNTLVEENSVLRQAAEVEKIAHDEVRGALLEAEREASELRQELAFYRNLMSPGDNRTGIHIEAATLGADLLPNTYRYELVVTQVRGKNRYARGQLLVKISGARGGDQQVLTLADVTPDGDASLKFRFKYFQTFDGQIELPADFVPESIEFEAVSSVKGLESTSRSFDWQELIAGGTEINVGQD